jgi:hypothetical protein
MTRGTRLYRHRAERVRADALVPERVPGEKRREAPPPAAATRLRCLGSHAIHDRLVSSGLIDGVFPPSLEPSPTLTAVPSPLNPPSGTPLPLRPDQTAISNSGIRAEVAAGDRQPPTNGRAGGKLPAGKTTARSPTRNPQPIRCLPVGGDESAEEEVPGEQRREFPDRHCYSIFGASAVRRLPAGGDESAVALRSARAESSEATWTSGA